MPTTDSELEPCAHLHGDRIKGGDDPFVVAGIPDHHCRTVLPITLIQQYRFATPNPLQTRSPGIVAQRFLSAIVWKLDRSFDSVDPGPWTRDWGTGPEWGIWILDLRALAPPTLHLPRAPGPGPYPPHVPKRPCGGQMQRHSHALVAAAALSCLTFAAPAAVDAQSLGFGPPVRAGARRRQRGLVDAILGSPAAISSLAENGQKHGVIMLRHGVGVLRLNITSRSVVRWYLGVALTLTALSGILHWVVTPPTGLVRTFYADVGFAGEPLFQDRTTEVSLAFLDEERWTPSFGQVFVTAKVESGFMIQAAFGWPEVGWSPRLRSASSLVYASSGVRPLSDEWGRHRL